MGQAFGSESGTVVASVVSGGAMINQVQTVNISGKDVVYSSQPHDSV